MFEYTTEYYKSFLFLDDMFNDRAKKGWELVSCFQPHGDDDVFCVFRRDKRVNNIFS